MDFMVFLAEQWLLVGVLAVLVSALIVVEGRRGGQSLSFHEVTRLINQGNAVVVDVRDAKEFKSGHIVEAINIPYQKLADRSEELAKHQGKTIVIVDKVGQHAGASGKLLREKGFSVNRLQGGMAEWQGQNLPVIKS